MTYGGKRGSYRSHGTFSGQLAGQKAKPVWICRGCGEWHYSKPGQCRCGRMDFDFYHSSGEAKQWFSLLLLQRGKEISDLERQVTMPLMTIDHDGHPVEFGTMVVDFRWRDKDGTLRLGDFKPEVGIDYAAKLKIRCLEMMGYPVQIFT